MKFKDKKVMNEDFEKLRNVIIKKVGFFPTRYKERPLKRRIAVRMRHNNITTYLEYAEFLENDRKEQVLLHKALTINVSKFFRNYETFKKIEEVVLVQLLGEAKRRGSGIKVWCAGCASGEETYTIAMLIDKFLIDRKSSISFSVIGTDIDDDSLSVAQVGCYGNEVFSETPRYYLKEYFREKGKFCVLDRIKKHVNFVKLDVEDENRDIRELDLVLFRNVLIYLERTFQEKILQKIYNRLNLNGFIVLGKVETLVGNSKSLFRMVDTKERIYKKCPNLKR